jgi:hypothetical protein
MPWKWPLSPPPPLEYLFQRGQWRKWLNTFNVFIFFGIASPICAVAQSLCVQEEVGAPNQNSLRLRIVILQLRDSIWITALPSFCWNVRGCQLHAVRKCRPSNMRTTWDYFHNFSHSSTTIKFYSFENFTRLLSLFWNKLKKAYEITLLFVCASIPVCVSPCFLWGGSWGHLIVCVPS